MSEVESIKQHIEKWVEQFVISLNLCPFAKAVFPNQTLIDVCSKLKFEDIYKVLIEQMEHLLSKDENVLSTSIIAVPSGLNKFDDFLDMLDVLERALQESELDNHIQIAPFHPNFEFDTAQGSHETLASVKSNQSPYPLFHFLRVKQVEQVLTAGDTAEKIVERNKNTLNEIGEKGIDELFESLMP